MQANVTGLAAHMARIGQILKLVKGLLGNCPQPKAYAGCCFR